MAWSNEYYYLICNNEKYDNLMHLRLDRISSVEILQKEKSRHFSEVSDYKNEFDTADYMSKVFMMFGGELQNVNLRCKNRLLESVIDRFGDKIPIRASGKEHFAFRKEIIVSEGLISWILQFGADIEVIDPQDLRAKLCSKTRELRLLYHV